MSCSTNTSLAPPAGAVSAPAFSPATTGAESSSAGKPTGLTWTASGSTTEGAFTACIRTHTVALGGKEPTELTYATLERNGRILQRFDGVRHIAGNETRVSFTRLPGLESTLAVEQETYRGWRFWIVAMSPRARTLIDSQDWGVGRNLRAEDVDGDGSVELVQSSLHYWFFDRFTNLDSPFPEVIFQFDPSRQRFVPANAHYSTHVDKRLADLRMVVEHVEGRDSDRALPGSLLGAVVGVMLELCYSGRTNEAWDYFDLHYTLPDCAERRALLQRQIATDPVFRAVAPKAG